MKILKGGTIINRGKSFIGDVLIDKGRIQLVAPSISRANAEEINVEGKWVIPGIIDDQVHFREPGLTHKANIGTESRAAVAGGVTTFMEMPNTKPNALTQELLQDKYDIAEKTAYCNYSFFMGAGNDNIEEVLKTDKRNVCGVKIFMGSSTGNMLVDNRVTLENLFSKVDMLIATHCEDEATIRNNMKLFEEKYGDALTANHHPLIRDVEGCYLSSSMAVEMAKRYNTRLHILHISTAKELDLFSNSIPLQNKRITSEVCVHHLHFSADDYDRLGNNIKCNPAIKSKENRDALLPALLDDRLDIIATDHAPHTMKEKANPYSSAPSGLPLVQHSINVMMEMVQEGKISKEKVIEKMCHAPAECFQIVDRGYIEEGYFADIAVIDPYMKWTISKENVLYKCGWSPLEGKECTGRVTATFVNGEQVYDVNHFSSIKQGFGKRITFDRK
ncbi:MAG: dihydroorotase [Saprospiraceae bacterium]|nr:dihydroorotase [Saprospiraceae bacterium]